MSHARRSLVLAVAWALPIAWLAAALLAGPSDGTSLTSSPVAAGGEPWGQTVTVARVYGDTPMRAGDQVLSVDGRSPGSWLAAGAAGTWEAGDEVAIQVRRAGAVLDRIQTIDVRLGRYPVLAALGANVSLVGLLALLLLAGSLAWWRRPGVAAGALLASAALAPTALTAGPLGPGAVDVAAGRGVWTAAAGGVGGALALGAMLLFAQTVGAPPRRRWPAVAVAALVPALGYAAWLGLVGPGGLAAPARAQALLTVLGPALVAATAALLGLLVAAHARAVDREDRLATRLVLLGVGGALGARLLLGDLPRSLGGDPLLPGTVVALLTVPPVLVCAVVATTRRRLDEVEPTVRRALVQASAVAVVGAAFIGAAGAAELLSDLAVGSMVAGGLLATLLLPLALGLQRTLRRLVYGDRDFPQRVVSELRLLDPVTAPEEALRETLDLLARRLHLSHAAIDVPARATTPSIATSIGTSRGNPVVVDLAVGGTPVGRLRLEVDPARDPFGPADRRLLEDVGAQVGTLVQAVTVNRELQRSRQGLITAREEERRRIRRDLHDGLGPSLATMAMRLEAAHDLIAADPAGAAELVGRLSDQARADIAEVRRLVDGLRPPALDQFGLVSALRQRADAHNAGARGAQPAMRWAVSAADDVEPLPAAVEVAAYLIALEAVNNAQRHSGATGCEVSLRRDDGALHLEVRDDGEGLADDVTLGVGLTSMRERAEELGGVCTVTSPAGGGTVVAVVLPVTGEGR